jgi:hypothetical protein
MHEDATPRQQYQLPHQDNYLGDDVGRIRLALSAIDGDVALILDEQKDVLIILEKILKDIAALQTTLASSEVDGLMSKDDKAKLDEISGSGADLITLAHSSRPISRTGTEYGVMSQARWLADFSWHRETLKVFIDRSVSDGGVGRIRIGCAGVVAEGPEFSIAGTDALTLDLTSVATNQPLALTIEGKSTSGKITVSRLKAVADPVNEMAGVLAICVWPETSVSTTELSGLDDEILIPTIGQGTVSTDSSVQFDAYVVVEGASSAELQVVVSGSYNGETASEDALIPVNATGRYSSVIPFPSLVAPILKISVSGKIVSGSGSMSLDTWQAKILS